MVGCVVSLPWLQVAERREMKAERGDETRGQVSRIAHNLRTFSNERYHDGVL